MTDAFLTPEIFAKFVNVSRETLTRLETYAALLVKWQAAINLVGRDTLPDLWRRHMLDSAQLAEGIAPAKPDGAPLTILDLGSGAGFPGLVLAIMGADQGRRWSVHLAESDARKCAFLATVARETGVEVKIHTARIEKLTPFAADIVTARALASLDALLAYAAPFLTPDSECLFLKGATAEDELTLARKSWNMAIERQPSRSGPAGSMLRIREISRVKSNS
ncbi:MAG TPA: 16S rRNA (guanine(527)-N(7))-methyltransferase RsmG [Alphaproteobacteria bacterium]